MFEKIWLDSSFIIFSVLTVFNFNTNLIAATYYLMMLLISIVIWLFIKTQDEIKSLNDNINNLRSEMYLLRSVKKK